MMRFRSRRTDAQADAPASNAPAKPGPSSAGGWTPPPAAVTSAPSAGRRGADGTGGSSQGYSSLELDMLEQMQQGMSEEDMLQQAL